MLKPIYWSMSELADAIKQRILNKFDSNIAVTGKTGIGKSTCLFKVFNKFPDFKIKDKFTMNRTKMIELIKNYQFSYCWNDELISSGSKRTFFDQEQNELIQVLTKYRNNFNVVGGAVPYFFTLDKELIKLFGMHINIPERGVGIIHLPREGRMYNEDIWDVKINQKLEEQWSAKKLKNPHFKIPYHKYTTYAGTFFFGEMTKKQEELYESLKSQERGDSNEPSEEEKISEENFYERCLRLIKEGKMNEKSLFNACEFHGKRLSSVKVSLNRMLKDEGSDSTLKDFLQKETKTTKDTLLHNNSNIELVPTEDL